MSELPKSVEGRLRAESARREPGEHPSAEQLSAFCEQALAKAERKGVVEHLSGCVACREIVALASVDARAEEPVSENQLNRGRGGLRYIRWSATAVALVISAVLVMVAVREQKPGGQAAQQNEIAMERQAEPAAQKAAAPAPAAGAPVANAAKAEPVERASELASAKDAPNLRRQEQAKHSAAMASADAAVMEKKSSSAEESAEVMSARSVGPMAAPASAPAGTSAKVADEVSAPAMMSAQSAPMAMAKAAPSNTATMMAKQAAPQMAAGGMAARRARSAAFWRVQDGRLETSVDGQRWNVAAIPPGEKILSFAREGIMLAAISAEHVFVSSDAGVVFHQSSGSWQAPLAGVSLSQGQVTVTDSAKDVWISRDDGATWSRQ